MSGRATSAPGDHLLSFVARLRRQGDGRGGRQTTVRKRATPANLAPRPLARTPTGFGDAIVTAPGSLPDWSGSGLTPIAERPTGVRS
jgi:hypothetical protein